MHLTVASRQRDFVAGGRCPMLGEEHDVTRWAEGERTVTFLIGRGRLESFESNDPAATAEALVSVRP